MSQLIFIDRHNAAALSGPGGGQAVIAPFTAGETRRIALRFLTRAGGEDLIAEDPDVRSITASLGVIDGRPNAGTLRYQIGSGPSNAANTTAALLHNHTARVLQNAINDLSAVVSAYGTVTVLAVPGGYTLWFANATGPVQIRARENRLSPNTVVRHFAYEHHGAWVQEVRLVQAQLASTSQWDRVLPPPPTVETVRDGGEDEFGTKWTEVQRLNIPPTFRGTYQLRRPDTMARTPLLSRADGPDPTREAIQAIYPEGTIEVTNPDDNYGLIEFGGGLAGVNVEELEVVVSTAPPGDPTFVLDLRRPGVYAALRERDDVEAWFEIRANIAEPGAGVEDPGKPVVLTRRRVSLRRDQNFDGMEAITEPRWHRPPNPVDYIPSTTDQQAVGAGHWSGAVGDGVNASVVIDHDLGTDAIASVSVRVNVSDGEALVPGVDYVWRATTANSLTLEFQDGAPSEDQYYVVIMSAASVTEWLPHTHTIGQVVDLTETLEDIVGRIVVLEAILPSTGPGALAGQGSAGLIINIPEVAEVLFYPVSVERSEDGAPRGLPRRGQFLLPAIHTATTGSLTTPLPEPGDVAGDVLENETGSAIIIPGRYGGVVPPGGFAASDGRKLYPASQWQDSNSYYPQPFERTLFAAAVNDQMFRVNQTFDCRFGLRLQLVSSDSKCQWVLVIEKGTAPAEASPDPVGLNLEDIEWDPVPVLAQRIILSRLLQTHFFGVRMRRTTGGISLDRQIYAAWEGANDHAPSSANFVLRARLVKFDTENSRPNARGWVFHETIGSVSTSADGATTTQPARITIS